MEKPFSIVAEKGLKTNWLPELDTRRTPQLQEVHLLVKMTVRRFKHGFIYLGNLN